MKRNINEVRQDLEKLSTEKFAKKYGVKEETIKKGLSDTDLEKIAGGWRTSDGWGL